MISKQTLIWFSLSLFNDVIQVDVISRCCYLISVFVSVFVILFVLIPASLSSFQSKSNQVVCNHDSDWFTVLLVSNRIGISLLLGLKLSADVGFS